MVWALFLLFGVIAAIHAYEYNNSVSAYNFTQPPKLDSAVMNEKTPIVLEIGVLPWRPGPPGSWTVITEDGISMSSTEFWKLENKMAIGNGEELAVEMGLATGLAELNDARPWWWLSGLSDVAVEYLVPGRVKGFQWITAERQWVGCSAGDPITVWLVHSRYRRFLPDAGVDPWTITVADNPWIGRVQYIEVRIKPGWCLGVPAHWGFAVRPEVVGSEAAKSGSAIWSAAQHSALSWCMSNSEYGPWHTELWNQWSEVISPSPNTDQ
jgi:hypothetical protein